MKNTLFICLVLIASSVGAQTNKYVILKHRDKQKEVAVAQGEFVIITTFKGEKMKGPLEVLSDKLIRIKHQIVPLTSIQSFGRRNRRIYQIASTMVSTGMNITLFGLSDNLRHGWDEPSDNYKAGIPMLIVGIPMMVLSYKRTSENWTYVGTVGDW